MLLLNGTEIIQLIIVRHDDGMNTWNENETFFDIIFIQKCNFYD